jgi:plasmid segregation protein ParM
MVLELRDGSFVMVGDTAVTHSRFVNRREDRHWLKSDAYYHLFLAALTELTPSSVGMEIVTGLPVDYYLQDRDEMRDLFMGQHWIRRGEKAQTITVTRVRVIPQPFGSLLSVGLGRNVRIQNNDYVNGNVGVIDVGGKTTNLLSVYKLQEIARETASVELGGWDIVRGVREVLEAGFPELRLRDHEVGQIIKQGWVRYYGQKHSVSELFEPVLEPMADQVVAQASQLWGSAARLDEILLTGGGSHMLANYIGRHFSHVSVLDEPVYGNVEGYYRFSQRD